MNTSHLDYTSFLIRLWREAAEEGDSAALTIQVEHIPDRERRYFASLEQMFAYLRERVCEMPVQGSSGKAFRQAHEGD